MTTPSWLDVGDKVASLAGVLLGAAGLAQGIAHRRRGVAGGTDESGEVRRVGQVWLTLSVGLGSATLGVVVVVWATGLVSGRGRLWFSGAGFAAGVGALAAVVVHRLVRRRSPFPLPDLVREIVTAQWEDAFQHSYRYVLGSAPPLSRIYVEQTAEAPSMGGEGGAGRAMTLREVLAGAEHPLIVADPGTGKTTAVARVVAEQCGWWRSARAAHSPAKAPYGPVVPVVVPADALADLTLPEAMRGVWARMVGREVEARLFERPPVPGTRWLVLVDGLDQVLTASERSRLLTRLGNRIAEGGSAHRFLVTTRPLAFGELGALGDVGRFSLRKFTRQDLEEFAHAWTRYRAGTATAGPTGLLTAELFLARVSGGRLAPVVRVPLLATIAALLLEAERDRELPGSRTELYERFVQHLLHGRQEMMRQRTRLAGEFRGYGARGERAWRWFGANLVPLLEGIADAHLSAGRSALLAEAEVWVRRRALPEMLAAVPGWEGLLRALLEATGVLVFRPGGVEFLHQSFAEYLAAGPRAGSLERRSWLADVRSPDSRSLALFVLGRSATSADTEVGLLLERRGGDACIAGEIMVDGADVSPELRARVVAALLDQLVAEEPTAPAALHVLTDLIGEPGVRTRLDSLVADPGHRPWVRAFTADALCDVTADSVSTLRGLVQEPTLPAMVRRWAARRLAARGQDTAAEQPFLHGDTRPNDLRADSSVLAINAFTQVVEDRAATPTDRLEALRTLAQYGAGRTVTTWLAEILTDQRLSQDARLDAARALASVVDAAWNQTLHGLSSDPDVTLEVRVPILIALAGEGWNTARTALEQLATVGGAEFLRQFPAIRGIRETVGQRSAEQTRESATAQAATVGLPQRNRNFTGRDDLLSELHRRLTRFTEPLVPVVLHGFGGVGKTQLAIEYAWRHAGDYDLICWLPAENRSLLLAGLATLGETLGLVHTDGVLVKEAVAGVIDALGSGTPHRRWLLILDNADQPGAVHDLLPAGPGHVILTSRNHQWAGLADVLDLTMLTRAASARFLTRRAPALADDEATKLAEELGALPLALEQAGALIAETGMSGTDYLHLLAQEADRILESDDLPSDYPVPVSAAWMLAITRLRDQMPTAAALLHRLAYLASGPVPLDMFTQARHVLAEPLSSSLADPDSRRRILRELARHALARVNSAPETIHVHRLIQKLIQEEFDQAQRDQAQHDAQLLLAAADPGHPENPDNWPTYAQLRAHLGPSSSRTSTLTEVRLLCRNIVSYLTASGDPTAALQECQTMLAAWQADSPPDDPDLQHLTKQHADLQTPPH